MNKTSIEWTQNPDGTQGYTWNPMTGCETGCSYCYARKIATRFAGTPAFPNGFAPTWHPERLDEPLKVKTPSRIFVGSMTDMFGPWVTDSQITQVFATMAACSWHTFYLLTKWPQNIGRLLTVNDRAGRPAALVSGRSFPNVWLGVSVTDKKMACRAAPHTMTLRQAGWHVFVSIEPMLEQIVPFTMACAEWWIIGAQTGPGAKAHQPQREWVTELTDYGDRFGIPTFLKSSITALWPDLTRREWPQ